VDLLYIFGDPGIGKSSLMAALVGGQVYESRHQPFAHMVFGNGVVQLGSDRTPYGGTDALALDVQPKVTAWLQQERPDMVLAEGDRLANSRFFAAVVGMGYHLWPVYLTGKDMAAVRRRQRAQELGIQLQDARWVANRNSKNTRLAGDWDALSIHPALPASVLKRLLPGPVAQVFLTIDPVAERS
jgi:GTPase SAR1 family protein